MNTQNMLKWIIDLETTEEGQTKGRLCGLNPDTAEPTGFCCLGRTCEVSIADGVILDLGDDFTYKQYGSSMRRYSGSAHMPPQEVYDWLGVTDEDLIGKEDAPIFEPIAHYFEDGESITVDHFYEACAEWNDSQDATFSEIARRLRDTFGIEGGDAEWVSDQDAQGSEEPERMAA